MWREPGAFAGFAGIWCEGKGPELVRGQRLPPDAPGPRGRRKIARFLASCVDFRVVGMDEVAQSLASQAASRVVTTSVVQRSSVPRRSSRRRGTLLARLRAMADALVSLSGTALPRGATPQSQAPEGSLHRYRATPWQPRYRGWWKPEQSTGPMQAWSWSGFEVP